jgi:hypothetical protein
MFIVYIGRKKTEYETHIFVTTKKKEPAFLGRYHGMELDDQTKWKRYKVHNHSVLFCNDDKPEQWLDAE